MTALLHQTGVNKPFRWKIELVDIGKSKGFVYINALDDTVAAFSGPAPAKGAQAETPKTAAGLGQRGEAYLPRHRWRPRGILHRRATVDK